MLRRHRRREPPPPAWRESFDRARDLVGQQHPPAFIIDRLVELERALVEAHADIDRLDAALARLDSNGAAVDLKRALREPNPPPGHDELVATLRARHQSINRLLNRRAELRSTVERSLVHVDLVAVRAIELGSRSDRWRLDDAVDLLSADLTALDLAHRELADL